MKIHFLTPADAEIMLSSKDLEKVWVGGLGKSYHMLNKNIFCVDTSFVYDQYWYREQQLKSYLWRWDG